MEEVRIYHSVWLMLLIGFTSLVLAVLSIIELLNHRVSGWIGLLFGLGGLTWLYRLMKERLAGHPFITITDESIIYSGCEIRFADVESFKLLTTYQGYFIANYIGIRYKKDVERQKMENANLVRRLVLKYRLAVSGMHTAIYVTGASIKAQKLCDLLNDRLSPSTRLKSRRASKTKE